MNPLASLRAIPGALMDAVAVAWSHIAEAGDDEPDTFNTPLPPHEAGRVALEMVMVMRSSRENPGQYQPMMRQIFADLDGPQQVIDVALSLTGMVAVLAREEDLTRFGEFILKHEVEDAL